MFQITIFLYARIIAVIKDLRSVLNIFHSSFFRLCSFQMVSVICVQDQENHMLQHTKGRHLNTVCLPYNFISDLRNNSVTRIFLCLDIYKRQEFVRESVLRRPITMLRYSQSICIWVSSHL